ncbi:SPOR domain-containing protein [Campylobacterota bacterium DY0563]|uniref:SPOR domain-containing protein n=1 Tax=Halarcobacter sp. TaxID=2321133 RepID=UPI0029F522C4|nr:SPOR domain-containing protein [Halarcobacter sp.]
MEIRGEDFIKKVQLKQEKSEIEERLNEIKNNESSFEQQEVPQPQQPSPSQSQLDREIEIQEEREYSDIMLGKNTSNEQSKKKYLVLGLILVILFLLTIIIIRLLTNDSTSNDSFTKDSSSNTENSIGNENIEEQYQKIINEKLKNIKEEKEKEAQAEEKVDENLSLEKIEQKELVEEAKVEESKPDVFNVKEEIKPTPPKKVVEKKPAVKKTQPKVIQNAISSSTSAITTKPKGTFVQIGAFSKMPSAEYLNTIKSKGFSYKVYKVSINGKVFHKVLIGPYSSRGQAKNATDNIKRDLNVTGAFILTY